MVLGTINWRWFYWTQRNPSGHPSWALLCCGEVYPVTTQVYSPGHNLIQLKLELLRWCREAPTLVSFLGDNYFQLEIVSFSWKLWYFFVESLVNASVGFWGINLPPSSLEPHHGASERHQQSPRASFPKSTFPNLRLRRPLISIIRGPRPLSCRQSRSRLKPQPQPQPNEGTQPGPRIHRPVCFQLQSTGREV